MQARCALARTGDIGVSWRGPPVARLDPFVGRAAAHLARQIQAGHVTRGARQRYQPLRIGIDARERGPHRAVGANVSHQRARIDLGHGHDATLAQVVGQALARAPVAHGRTHVTHHQTGRPDAVALVVFRIDADVADMGRGHRHDLTMIRGVGEDFLVTGDAGVEDDFAGRLAQRAKTGAGPDCTVFQSKQGWGWYRHRNSPNWIDQRPCSPAEAT